MAVFTTDPLLRGPGRALRASNFVQTLYKYIIRG